MLTDIPGYEGLYAATEDGRIWSYPRKDSKGRNLKGRFFIPTPNPQGYLRVELRKDGKPLTLRVHRLIAITFIPNPLNLPEVNHKDGVKPNCHKNNLEWASNEENVKHAIKNGLVQKRKRLSSFHGVSRKSDLRYHLKPWYFSISIKGIQTQVSYFASEKEAAQGYNDYVIANNLNRVLNILD